MICNNPDHVPKIIPRKPKLTMTFSEDLKVNGDWYNWSLRKYDRIWSRLPLEKKCQQAVIS